MNALKTAALVVALASGTSGAALAQTTASNCPAGYVFSNGVCQPSASAHPAVPAGLAAVPAYSGSSTPPVASDPGPSGFGPTSYSYTAYKWPWPDGDGACPAGYVATHFAKKTGCFPAH